MRRTAAAVAAALLLLAGCGDDDTETSTDTSVTTETTVEDATTTTQATTTSTTSVPAGELPGERIDIFPYEGAALAVVGVEADDTLNVRSTPSVEGEIVDELEPLADGITATGHNRQLEDGGFWAEIDTGETTGWVNTSYVAQVGPTEDVTSGLYPDTADRPVADTLVQLGERVADEVSGEGEPEPRVVVVDGPDVGDLGEITVDVLDYPDDAVLGERLRIFAEEEGGESFRLRTVESTTLCRRGVTDDGSACL